jgi:hypothetical protein
MLKIFPTKINKIPLHLKMVFLFSKYKFDNEQVIKEELKKILEEQYGGKEVRLCFLFEGQNMKTR